MTGTRARSSRRPAGQLQTSPATGPARCPSRVVLLTPEQADLVEAVARRVVELLDERVRPAGLVDAGTLARLLGISRSTVYDHVEELGGRRLGDGPRAPVRFDVETALEAWTRRFGNGRSHPAEPPVTTGVAPRRGGAAAQSTGQLLPVRGETAA